MNQNFFDVSQYYFSINLAVAIMVINISINFNWINQQAFLEKFFAIIIIIVIIMVKYMEYLYIN